MNYGSNEVVEESASFRKPGLSRRANLDDIFVSVTDGNNTLVVGIAGDDPLAAALARSHEVSTTTR